MAKIGLQNFLFGILTEAQDGTPTYGVAHKPAKAISCNVSISNNDASLYADDTLAEKDTTFQNGTATLGIDDEDLDMMATLLGHSVEDGAIVRKANDVAPYVGFGRIVTKMVNNVYKYKVEFLYKVKFAEPSQEDSTKGESVEFGTSEIEGSVAALANGKWSTAKVFNTMADARSYLASFFAESIEYVSVSNTLVGATTSNPNTLAEKGEVYEATLSGDAETWDVQVFVGDEDVTVDVWSEATKKIEIPALSVNDNITIFAHNYTV